MAKKDVKKTINAATTGSAAMSTSSSAKVRAEFDAKIQPYVNTPDLANLYLRLKRNVAAENIDVNKVLFKVRTIFKGNSELEKEFYKVYNVSLPKVEKKLAAPALTEVIPEPLKSTSVEKSIDRGLPRTEKTARNEENSKSVVEASKTPVQVSKSAKESQQSVIGSSKHSNESSGSATESSKHFSEPEKSPSIVRYAQLRFLARGMSSIQDPTLASIGYSSLFLSTITKSPALQNLSSMISDFRMFCRMWSTPGVMEWGLDTADKAHITCRDALDENIVKLEAYSSILYQLLENMAYLSSKKVIRLSAKLEAKLWIYSCVMWSLYVQLELIRIARRLLSGKGPIPYKDLVTNLAWLPLTIHWSSEKGFLSQRSVGILGGIASFCNAVGQWRKLAKN